MAVDQRTTFPLPDDHFSGQQNITGSIAGLEDLFNQVNEETASITYEDSHYYLNADTGDDDNDGLTSSTPKGTVAGLTSILPIRFEHNSSIHIEGTFTEHVSLYPHVAKDKFLIVDGGDTYTTVAGPFTADGGSSVSAVTTSSLSLTIDQYAGYLLKVDNDPTKLRLIQSHTADTFYPIKDLDTDPSGSTYSIVRPATTMQGKSIIVNASGQGFCQIQRVYFANQSANRFVSTNSSAAIYLSHIVSDCTSSNVGQIVKCHGGIFFSAGIRNPDTFAYDSSAVAGVSMRTAGKTLQIVGSNIAGLGYSYVRNIELSDCKMAASGVIIFGTRVHGQLTASGMTDLQTNGYFFRDTLNNFRPLQIDGSSDVGAKFIKCFVTLNASNKAAMVVKDNTSHGIELINSVLIDNKGGLAGTGNGGAGIYAHTGSHIHTKSGTPPTITGTVGDLAVADPAAQKSTWANVESVGRVTDTDEMVVAKKV